MTAWSIYLVTFCNNQHWQPIASITELQRFLGSIVAKSAGDACGLLRYISQRYRQP